METNKNKDQYRTPECQMLEFAPTAVLMASAATQDYNEVEFDGIDSWI